MDKKQLEIFFGKNPDNYETTRNDTCVFEQKPIKVENFKKIEQRHVKERVEKRKQKHCEVAEKKKTVEKKSENWGKIRKKKKKCKNV